MKQRSLFALFGLLLVTVVAGCSSRASVDAFSQLDPYQRTIFLSAPPSGDLTIFVKNVLQNNDFLVGDSQTALRSPRYAMQLNYSANSICLPRFDTQYDYDLVITDLKMGGHVFAMHGTDCQHTILDRLDTYIKNKPM